jgi:hypothetical protein
MVGGGCSGRWSCRLSALSSSQAGAMDRTKVLCIWKNSVDSQPLMALRGVAGAQNLEHRTVLHCMAQRSGQQVTAKHAKIANADLTLAGWTGACAVRYTGTPMLDPINIKQYRRS